MEQFCKLIAVILLLGGSWNLFLLLLFLRKDQRGTTLARLIRVQSRKNVPVRRRGARGPTFTAPNSSTGTYSYTVAGKDYRLKGWQLTAPGQLPKMPRVVYLKRFPRHACLDNEMRTLPEIWRAFLLLLTGAVLLMA